jgi:hypothetical protein
MARNIVVYEKKVVGKRAFCAYHPDGTPYIVVDESLAPEVKESCIRHEIRHILDGKPEYLGIPGDPIRYKTFKKLERMGKRKWVRSILDSEVRAYSAQAKSLIGKLTEDSISNELVNNYLSMNKSRFRRYVLSRFKVDGMTQKEYYSQGYINGIKRLKEEYPSG